VAELFVLAEKVDLAEKAIHNALMCGNEAQIGYLREPSIVSRQVLEKSKAAEAAALEILDTDDPAPLNWSTLRYVFGHEKGTAMRIRNRRLQHQKNAE
jgi:hypothetical protein